MRHPIDQRLQRPATPTTSKRALDVLSGDLRAASRLMRDIDDRIPRAVDDLKSLYPHTGNAYIIGITGNPGAGKSTVVDALISLYRQSDMRVGVVAVDPTSPFSGGAILGDRIRMQRHALDDGVFVRSLATRGHLGGLSRSTFDVALVMDAMGYDRVLVETVGVGQDEIEVMRAASTSVVITVPGLGDDIQAIKAGLLEIADVLVVNKADREGADRTTRDLLHMLDLRGTTTPREVEIIQTIASLGKRDASGVARLKQAIERHREQALDSATGRARTRRRLVAHVTELVKGFLSDRVETALAERGGLDTVADAIAAGETDPYSAAETLITSL